MDSEYKRSYWEQQRRRAKGTARNAECDEALQFWNDGLCNGEIAERMGRSSARVHVDLKMAGVDGEDMRERQYANMSTLALERSAGRPRCFIVKADDGHWLLYSKPGVRASPATAKRWRRRGLPETPEVRAIVQATCGKQWCCNPSHLRVTSAGEFFWRQIGGAWSWYCKAQNPERHAKNEGLTREELTRAMNAPLPIR